VGEDRNPKPVTNEDSRPPIAFAIRLATVADLEAIRAIFNYYVERSTCTFQIEPETAEERLEWFRGRSERHPVTVAVVERDVLGWAALSPWKARCAYAHSAEVSVYVHPDHHRRGVGRALLLDLIERGRCAGLHTLIGGACSEQTASLALQSALGFEPVGTFRAVGRKFDRWLDVAYMQFVLESGRGDRCAMT
jgi:phosphinothricin acetyltransferase